jgi:hypothetical protein
MRHSTRILSGQLGLFWGDDPMQPVEKLRGSCPQHGLVSLLVEARRHGRDILCCRYCGSPATLCEEASCGCS